MQFNDQMRRLSFRVLIFALGLSLASCHNPQTPQKRSDNTSTFSSPEDAGAAVVGGLRAGDPDALLLIFGPEAEQLLYSGDPVDDKNASRAFVARYDVMHRWRNMADGTQTLIVGADNFPFPIPLKKNADGNWYFDTAAGKEEVLNRRIGRNELATIEVCRAAADAEGEYFSQLHDGDKVKQFAATFISDAGKHNGLYWEAVQGESPSPLGPLAASAKAEGYSAKPQGGTAFHGYYFHMLKGQTANAPGGAKTYAVDGKMTDGFAFVAYPVKYGNSGVMTFIINQDGILLQKDLGKDTSETAGAMTLFDPDTGWEVVE
jgi:hypothetical protein